MPSAANRYCDEYFSMSLAVLSSKPYRSKGVVEFDVSAPGMSVLLEKDNRAAVDEMIPSDHEALGLILVLMKLTRPAQESSMLAGSMARAVVRITRECLVGTQGAVIVVSFVLGKR